MPRDRSRATLTLPKGVALPSPEERKTIAATAAATLGMGNAKPAWQFTGPQVKLHLSLPVPAPGPGDAGGRPGGHPRRRG